MAKNQPPVNAGDHEALRQAERRLRELLASKKNHEKKLIDSEYRIYQLESAYLQNVGNLMRGYEGYVSRQNSRRKTFSESERMFSGSSASSKFSLLRKEMEMDGLSEKREATTRIESRSVKRRKIKMEAAEPK